MVNAWWEPLHFTFQEPGDWTQIAATARPEGTTLAARSAVIWAR